MRVERQDNKYGMVALVYPFEGEHHYIRVERQREFGEWSKWEPEARVHWSAFMPQPVEFARRYAEAIISACNLAALMNAVADHEHTTPGGYMVEYRRGEQTTWERVEDGAEVKMHDGWTVAKVPAALQEVG